MVDLRSHLPTPEELSAVVDELRHGAIRIGVFGEFSAGKSTFLNALLGEDLLSVATEPTTATPTRITYGRDFGITVRGAEGVVLATLFEQGKVPSWARFVGRGKAVDSLRPQADSIRTFLRQWTTESGQASRTGEVVIEVPQPFLKDRLALVDTPGTNVEMTRHRHLTEKTAAAVDIACCLIDARQGGKATELEFVATVARLAPHTVVVVGKLDCIDPEEREEVIDALHQSLMSRWPKERGECPIPMGCSALAVLDAQIGEKHPDLKQGFSELRVSLENIARSQRGRLILARAGWLDRKLAELANLAETNGDIDLAHRAFDEAANLLGEAGISDDAVRLGLGRTEHLLAQKVAEIDVVRQEVIKATATLQANGGVKTPEVHSVIMRAEALCARMNASIPELDDLRRLSGGDEQWQRLLGEEWTKATAAQLEIGRAERYSTGCSPGTRQFWFKAAHAGSAIAQNIAGILCFYGGHGLDKNTSQAALWYRKAADQGNADAQIHLGYCYQCGTGVSQDDSQAVVWFRKAADQGHARAQISLGYCYCFNMNGTGVEDWSQGVLWYRKAADQGNADAQGTLGGFYADDNGVPQDWSQAALWYRKAADQGDAYAQFSLGDCYANGNGVPQDDSQAVAWFRKAADQGNADAQFSLDRSYALGTGVPQDWNQAAEWLRKAADQGHAKAQHMLGIRYLVGRGVPKDEVLAASWHRKAADQGNADAQVRLGQCYEDGTGIPKDEVLAASWYRKAAEQGHVIAQMDLGRRCALGTGVPQDWNQAAEWLRKAADQGWSDGLIALGDCYENGHGVIRDRDQAFLLYRKAAESDQAWPWAYIKLGDCYVNAIGVPQDWSQAVMWYQKAADRLYPEADYKLGSCYANGTGVPQDWNQAFFWYKKAADQGNASAQFQLGDCYAFGKSGTKDYGQAAIWYRKAADQGVPMAQFSLGNCYASGVGVPRDLNQEVNWYRKAADQGLAMAQSNLGNCYANGTGVLQDWSQAVVWYRKAADQGYLAAKVGLAFCYLNGRGVPANRDTAFQLYLQAAQDGSPDGQRSIAWFYEEAKDYQQAWHWYEQAAKNGDTTAVQEMHRLKKKVEEEQSGCYISTAASVILQWEDDGPELMELRKFRDTFMRGNEQRLTEIDEYYRTAPQIVSAINSRDDAGVIWSNIGHRWLMPAVDALRKGDQNSAYLIYGSMVRYLQSASLDACAVLSSLDRTP